MSVMVTSMRAPSGRRLVALFCRCRASSLTQSPWAATQRLPLWRRSENPDGSAQDTLTGPSPGSARGASGSVTLAAGTVAGRAARASSRIMDLAFMVRSGVCHLHPNMRTAPGGGKARGAPRCGRFSHPSAERCFCRRGHATVAMVAVRGLPGRYNRRPAFPPRIPHESPRPGPGTRCRAGRRIRPCHRLRGLGLDLSRHPLRPGGWLAAAAGRVRGPLHRRRRGDVRIPALARRAGADPCAVEEPGGDGPDPAAAGQRLRGAVRAERLLRPGRGRRGFGAAVDGRVRRRVRPASDPDRMARHRHRFRRRPLAQRRQQPDRQPGGPGPAAGGADRLGLRLGVVARTRPAAAVHGRRRADAVRRRDDRGRGPAARREPARRARPAGHAGPGLPGGVRFDRGLQHLRVAAAPRAPGAGQQLCLRQPGHRRGPRRVAGRRALHRARPRCDGGDPGRRGDHHPGPGDASMSATPATTAIDRRGLAVTAGTFVLWGVVPVYWHLLKHVPAMQIMAHRVVWSALLVVAWLLLSNGFGWLRKLAAQPRALPALALSAVLIAFNWGLYIWAVNAGHVVETSLGYFINPLVNVVLGVLVLHERLRRMQWIAVGCAALGVAWLTVQAGSPPWIALGLAASFGLYGLVRKLVAVDPVAGLGLESL